MKVRVEAPSNMSNLDVAQAIVGPHWLLKAEAKPRRSTFSREPAMGSLYKEAVDAYDKMLDAMVKDIAKYLEQHIKKRLGKSDKVKPLVEPYMSADLQRIVTDYHLAYVAGMVSPEAIPPEILSRLIDGGHLPSDLAHLWRDTAEQPSPSPHSFTDWAFYYGAAGVPVRGPETKDFQAPTRKPLSTFRQEWNAQDRRLSPAEQRALSWSRQNAATYVQNLGTRVAHDLTVNLHNVDREAQRRQEEAIRNEVAVSVSRRDTWKELASNLGHATDDWARDLHRVAATEIQAAMHHGMVSAMKEKGGANQLVAKQPSDDACAHCKRLHLKGGVPRIFKLEELEANGTNVGRKAPAWKAIVGPTHPWCSCVLIEVPDGWGFDEDGDLVPTVLTRGERLAQNLTKHMPLGDAFTPDNKVEVRVADPLMRAAVDAVIAKTPPVIFTKRNGVTLITTDHPREGSALVPGDYAYWTVNEIRLSHDLDPSKIPRVLPHEIAHSTNMFLFHELGSYAAVVKWHEALWEISKEEGFVSGYADKAPIENHAEVLMQYIYLKSRLILKFPKQFAYCYKTYRKLLS